ncbi:hypothetical protein Pelo_17228 [Pelomyxa schiedti]|nr:hypothetical protein Pelo_17228 [Pelomyxa schiedti]
MRRWRIPEEVRPARYEVVIHNVSGIPHKAMAQASGTNNAAEHHVFLAWGDKSWSRVRSQPATVEYDESGMQLQIEMGGGNTHQLENQQQVIVGRDWGMARLNCLVVVEPELSREVRNEGGGSGVGGGSLRECSEWKAQPVSLRLQVSRRVGGFIEKVETVAKVKVYSELNQDIVLEMRLSEGMGPGVYVDQHGDPTIVRAFASLRATWTGPTRVRHAWKLF